MLQSMRLPRVARDLVTEQQQHHVAASGEQIALRGMREAHWHHPSGVASKNKIGITNLGNFLSSLPDPEL